MARQTIASGTVHKIPADFTKALSGKPKSIAAWESITPLARNEWICWIESVKKDETRAHHIKRAVAELAQGKRRPCCWIGCIHRKDKKVSASVQWVLNRRAK